MTDVERRHPPTGPFHAGELAAQERAGVRALASQVGRIVSAEPPAGAAPFLAAQRVLAIGAPAADGRLWASVLVREPGFLRLVDAHAVNVAARPSDADPLGPILARAASLGALAIDFGTRRRLRINGRSTPTPDGLRIEIEQVYGNCPKYIQRRTPGEPANRADAIPYRVSDGPALSAEQRRLVTGADTFFIATTTGGDVPAADVSHRGGNVGFVQVSSPTRLCWPDYPGNAMLMTLGNLQVNPAAGLVFVDWPTGRSLHLTGRAITDWRPEAAVPLPGAERVVQFEIDRAIELEHPEAAGWSAPEFSRVNPQQ